MDEDLTARLITARLIGGTVVVEGEHGDDAGSIHFYDANGDEVVMWDSQEWVDDPSLVFIIVALAAMV